jgi:uncharacterized protein (TIGR02466 family)
MKINQVFSSFITIEELQLDNDEIAKYCKDKIYSSTKYIEHNQTQSDDIDLDYSKLQPFHGLLDILQDRVNILHKELGFSDQYEHKICRIWANHNNSSATKQPHSHSDCTITGIYYVEGDEDTGDTVFMNPIAALPYVMKREAIEHYTDFTSGEINIHPKKGLLVLFPAWLMHYVLDNKTDKDRITIAFNFDIYKKQYA